MRQEISIYFNDDCSIDVQLVRSVASKGAWASLTIAGVEFTFYADSLDGARDRLRAIRTKLDLAERELLDREMAATSIHAGQVAAAITALLDCGAMKMGDVASCLALARTKADAHALRQSYLKAFVAAEPQRPMRSVIQCVDANIAFYASRIEPADGARMMALYGPMHGSGLDPDPRPPSEESDTAAAEFTARRVNEQFGSAA